MEKKRDASSWKWRALAIGAVVLAAYVWLSHTGSEADVSVGSAINPAHLISLMGAAVYDVDAYKFNVSFVDRVYGTNQGGYVNAVMGVQTKGVANVKTRWLASDVLTGMLWFEGNTSSDQEKNITIYVIDNSMYSKPQDIWFKQNITPKKLIWNNLTHPQQHFNLLKGSEMNISGPTYVGGHTVWVVDAKPRKEAVMGYLEQATSGGGIGGSVEGAQTIRDVRLWMWVDAERNLPLRSDIMVQFVDGDVTSQAEVITDLFDYGGLGAITVPPEVEDAIEDPSEIN
ncbi:Uncharacterised protein [uncultured archaeon]|nr:Uncharacterised protein [uncultured archaeon]